MTGDAFETLKCPEYHFKNDKSQKNKYGNRFSFLHLYAFVILEGEKALGLALLHKYRCTECQSEKWFCRPCSRFSLSLYLYIFSLLFAGRFRLLGLIPCYSIEACGIQLVSLCFPWLHVGYICLVCHTI